ncbi:MAG: phytanoyl-CoA dioxygenase family protein [Rhizobiales bacterium]|nr:phytanoyl-CoA dioxygenase family protein [Hyphomicrobiales bacterium]NRB14325.1 phytanoyl-CoA dioxygenase family protein [Hyphomicrobiales bacterium]
MPKIENKTKPQNLLNEFTKDGYVCVKPLYNSTEMAEINTQVARFIKDVVPTMPDAQVYFEDKNDRSSLKQLQKMFEYDEYFKDMMMNGPARKIAEELLQDEVVAVNMQYFNKPAGIGQPTPPHQDGYYFHLTPCEAVTGWLALEEVDEENGCIHYVNGSHNKQEFRKHGQTGVLGFSQGITDFGTADDLANEVSFPGQAGTFLMHHARTIHWAGANKSLTRSRRALGFIYYGASAKLDVATKQIYQKTLDEQLKNSNKI